MGNCYLAWAKCQVPLKQLSFNALGIYQDLLAETVFKSLQYFIVSHVHHSKSSTSSSTSERRSQLKARVLWPCKSTQLHSRKHFAFLYYLSSSASPKSISVATESCCMVFCPTLHNGYYILVLGAHVKAQSVLSFSLS